MAYGGIEAGGTKFVCGVGTGPDDVVVTRFPTRDPASTLADVVGFFTRRMSQGDRIDAIGIASFGPLELRPERSGFGRIMRTPKPGWSGVDIMGAIGDAFDVPVGLDTDVNGAALAEARWGAARDVRSSLYLTVGTGIGGGAIVDGEPIHGLVHPEMGHVAVDRAARDAFEGRCPFHRDCLEGMTSGPAIAERFGAPAEALVGPERDEARRLVAWYLASGLRSLVYAVAPERVVVGGGLSHLPGVIPRIRVALMDRLGGYPGLVEHSRAGFVVPAELGDLAGVSGALLLAERAARGR